MFSNYLKVAFRILLQQRSYSLINIGGLAIGVTCCLLIFQYVSFEYSFDEFNDHAPHLFRINQTTVQNDGEPRTYPLVGWAAGPAFSEETPEVVQFARLHPEYNNAVVSSAAKPDLVFEEERVFYADPAFLQMFSYPVVHGDASRALAEPGTVLLSRSTARKYFGDAYAIDQTLEIRGWISGSYQVAGILQDVPRNSHLQFDILLPMVDLLQKSQFNDPSTGWGWSNFITYVQLRPDADIRSVEQKFTEIMGRNREEDWRQTNTRGYVAVQPVLDIHLNDELIAPRTVMGSYRTVYFFTVIGLITLLVALVNYINLATARALNRAREVGVRKAVGAQKRQLFIQFLFESALTILVAIVLGLALAELISPAVNRVAGTHLSWTSAGSWLAVPAVFLVATLLAGLYPAFVLSSLRPVSVLKGKIARNSSWTALRRGLVVFQFAVSLILLVGTLVVFAQLNYLRTMDLGMELDQVLTIPGPRVLPEGTDGARAVETFNHQIRQIPAVHETATSFTVPGQGFAFMSNQFRRAGADKMTETLVSGTIIDTSFVRLYGLELLASEDFAAITYPVPEGAPEPLLINETAVRALGFDSPAAAVGEELFHGRVVGVIRDVNWSSGHDAIGNAMFYLSPGQRHISIKVGTENLNRTIAAIEETYKTHFPGNPFRYAFVDDQFSAQYKNDQRFAELFTGFAILALLIACLGLFGLATFSAQLRTKEIGIRRVMGASLAGIVVLLSSDFLKLVLIGCVIGAPMAFYVMHRWLDTFAYRIEIAWWIFALAGGLALLTALLTVSYQSIRAALADPVQALRSE